MSETASIETTGAEAAAPPIEGGSFLTDMASQPVPEAPPPAAGSADEAIQQAVVDGERPEWVPEKFWDAEKKQPRTEDMGKAYVNLEKLMSSQDRVTLPTSEDDDEGHERLFAALRPKEQDAYDFGERPELPPDLPYDEDSEQAYRNWAFANGLSQRQARGLYEGFVKKQIEAHANYAKVRQEQRTQLQHSMQREYGNGYDAALQRARSTMTKYGDPDFVQYLNETGLGNDPRMLRFAERVGKDMNGETRLVGKPQAQANPQDYQAAIATFNQKNEKALFDRSHPDHGRVVAERNKLFEAAYGGDAA